MGRLEGKVALVTGAARGIGQATAVLFAREGARVVVTDLLEEEGRAVVDSIKKSGGQAIFVPLDVTKADQWQRAVEATLSAYGKLDVLVNNAGIGNRATVDETDEALWDRMMDADVKSVFLGTKAVVPIMRRQGGGSIINISSIYGLIGSPTSFAYHTAKGAVRLLSKAAAIQLAKDKIRVNSVHPGFTITHGTREFFARPEVQRERLPRVPLGRFGTAEDIAYGILYLASDESSFVTGSELVIDGGQTAA